MRAGRPCDRATCSVQQQPKQQRHRSGSCDIDARSLLATTGNWCSAGRPCDRATCSVHQQQKQNIDKNIARTTTQRATGSSTLCVCLLFTSSGWRPITERSMLLCEAFQDFDSFDFRRGKTPASLRLALLGKASFHGRKCRLVQATSETDWPDSRPHD